MITFSNIQLMRGNKFLLQDASASINPKDKVGLVGKNGCGKSTLFALLKNELTIDSGSFNIPKQWKIAWVAQETPALRQSAIEYIIDGDQIYRTLEKQLTIAEQNNDGNLIAKLHTNIETIDGYTIKVRAARLLSGLGFKSEQMHWDLTQFSGGWRMRLNLAQALLCRSDLLLLDEPTNHLDLDAIIWLESWLKNYSGTLVLISHDRDFLDPLVTRILHISDQKINEYTGNYSMFEKQRAQNIILQQTTYQKQQKQIAHIQSYIDRFRYKASKARQAQSRLKALEKIEQIIPAQLDTQFHFAFKTPDALPNPILSMENVCVGYEQNVILKEIKLNLVAGSRIGLLGQNGAGKSTLIKLLAGNLESKSGKLIYSKGVKIGYFAQHQLDTLQTDETPLQHMMQIAPEQAQQQLRAYLGSFGFSNDKALEKVNLFSGGEKARLALAIIVWQKPNLLLLDEPTNHLDLDMRNALTIALQTFTGAMVIVSHDRYLLRATTDDFYLVHNKQAIPFDGDLDDYYQWLLQQQKKELINTNVTNSAGKTHNLETKKEQRRSIARIRQLTAPIRKTLTQYEAQIAKLTKLIEHTQEQLTDNDIYQAKNKELLTNILQEQKQYNKNLEKVELQWLEAQEQLELLELSINNEDKQLGAL